jgi:hypothetical protein
MIEIVAWAGAGLALIAGLGMLFAPAKPEVRAKTRVMGFVFLGLAAFNVFMATTLI